MKFMKLGNKPDTFYSAEAIRSISSDVSSDFIIQVHGTRYLLHKFPLLSKCGLLQTLSSDTDEAMDLDGVPGGTDAFEACAKFCYGISITISAFNFVAIRCAAEFLEMKEEIESGNLIYKLDIFFNSCILRGWKDPITALQSTKSLQQLSEELKITTRCIEAIASRVLSNPAKLNWANSQYSKGNRDECRGYNGNRSNSKGRWAEDIAEFSIDHYLRVMLVIKSADKVSPVLIGEALQVYAYRWLPVLSKGKNQKGYVEDAKSTLTKHKFILESMVSLLPVEKDSVSCRFLLKLLKACNTIGASNSIKTELARQVGMQLDEATVNDLLIPSFSKTWYDVDLVQTMLDEFMMQWMSPPTSPFRETMNGFNGEKRRSRSMEDIKFQLESSRRSSSASHCSKLRVAKLIDGYLLEVAKDPKLPMAKLIELADKIPDFARPNHDDLYYVIDAYLKEHPALTKTERKRLCRLLDCKKLSMEACIHAAQNELLPLRVVVQVLFFEHVKAAMSGNQINELPANIKALLRAAESMQRDDDNSKSMTLHGPAEDAWSLGLKSPKSKLTEPSTPTLRMRLSEVEHDGDEKNTKFKAFCAIPSKPKKMFSKLWSSNKGTNQKHDLS